MSIRGIDVSDYQPNVDWKAVANSGMAFAVIKSTEGATFVADVFAPYWKATKANGLIRGAYHFFRPASNIQGQIDNFLRIVTLEPGDLPPVLDIETTDGLDSKTVCDRAAVWLEAIEAATGYQPIIYTYPGFWQQLNTDRFSEYPLWIAHYTQAEKPAIPGKWKTWVFWQYTDRGQVDGIRGGVDVNIFESIRKGERGPKVELMQTMLKKRGVEPGVIDGIFGAGTERAVISFQDNKGSKEKNGVAGLKTWTALMGQVENFVPPPRVEAEPTPTPAPAPAPTPAPAPAPGPAPEPAPAPAPEPAPATTLELIDICRIYRGSATEDKALVWLQDKIPNETLLEFARLWRNQATPQTQSIRILDVCRYYRDLPNQNQALRWLQREIPVTILLEFEQKWNATPEVVVDIRLLDVCRFYGGTPTQKEAIEWLQTQIPAPTLVEFARLWRRPGSR
ncbi:hydrolase [Arthrospira sp. PCC 8006]|uniref:GH25 family lysozyme n=1 Tax=Arthrospira sp. PCC 8006 TaxID=1982224 RepID=UPI00396D2152